MAWWSSTQLDEIAAGIAEVMSGWRADWVPAGRRARCGAPTTLAHEAMQDPGAAITGAWRSLGGDEGEPSAWIRAIEGDPTAWVHEQLFGGTPGEISAAIARRAWTECTQRLRAALALQPCEPGRPDAPPAAVFRPWSGATVSALAGPGPTLQLLLDGRSARRLVRTSTSSSARRQPSLVPVSDALRHRRLRLCAVLTPCELAIGSLVRLEPGDVLPLDHALDQALWIEGPDGERLGTGLLGRCEDRKALQLALPA